MKPEYPKLSALPFLRIFLFLSGGILMGKHLSHEHAMILIAAILLIVAFTLLLSRNSPSPLKNYIPLFLLTITGILSQEYSRKKLFPETKEKIAEAVILEQVKNGDQWLSVVAKRESGEKIRGILKKEKDDGGISKNSILFLEGELQPIEGPLIYGDIDWRRINHGKEIFRMGFFRKWKILKKEERLSFKEKLNAKIQSLLRDPQLAAISSSLLIGERSGLDQELLEDFQIAGSVHLLAVSGLHVGFILLMLSHLFRFVNRKTLRLFLILSGIWSYTLLTGSSPSVLRASLMISIILIGQVINKKGNSINTLLAAGSLIILWDPDQLFDLGFQLSFTALGGILLFHPILSGIVGRRRKKWQRWIQDLLLLSIAAQLGTLPLMLLYFHQFPLWFLLTNILVIPLSAIILYTGTLSLLLSFFSEEWSAFPAHLHELTLKLLVSINHFIAQLPFARLKIPVFETGHAIIMAATALLAWWFLIDPKRKSAVLFSSSAIILSWSLAWRTQQIHLSTEVRQAGETILIRKGNRLLIAGKEKSIKKIRRDKERNYYLQSIETRIISWSSCKESPFYHFPFR